jgi:hypothetical protein
MQGSSQTRRKGARGVAGRIAEFMHFPWYTIPMLHHRTQVLDHLKFIRSFQMYDDVEISGGFEESDR